MKRWKIYLAAATTCLSLFSLGEVAFAAPGELDDLSVTVAVDNELLLEPAVPSHRIDVSTEQGVVTLSGTVDTYQAMLDARNAAESVKGVLAVVNEIEVKPLVRSDLVIRSNVVSALAGNPVTESYEIRVEVVDGVVTLTGEVDSRSEKNAAEEVAGNARGVVDVTNLLSYVFANDRLDGEVQADIRYRLRSDASIGSGLITVDVRDGKVTLAGSVGSAAEKREAETEAWFVPGVKSVVNDIDVTWSAVGDAGDWEKGWTDADTRKMIEIALRGNPWVSPFAVDVSVKEGAATLTGTVANLRAKREAEEEALDTLGVWRVKNYLRVRPPLLRSDADIAEDVRKALQEDPHVDRYDITVSVFSGKAYLRGDVDSWYMRQQAEEAAERVRGVVDIANRLHVTYEYTAKSDREIQQDIESELFWSPFVDSDGIFVEVHSGVATLTGSVEDWGELRIAKENARQGGATSVISDLDIENVGQAD